MKRFSDQRLFMTDANIWTVSLMWMYIIRIQSQVALACSSHRRFSPQLFRCDAVTCFEVMALMSSGIDVQLQILNTDCGLCPVVWLLLSMCSSSQIREKRDVSLTPQQLHSSALDKTMCLIQNIIYTFKTTSPSSDEVDDLLLLLFTIFRVCLWW